MALTYRWLRSVTSLIVTLCNSSKTGRTNAKVLVTFLFIKIGNHLVGYFLLSVFYDQYCIGNLKKDVRPHTQSMKRERIRLHLLLFFIRTSIRSVVYDLFEIVFISDWNYQGASHSCRRRDLGIPRMYVSVYRRKEKKGVSKNGRAMVSYVQRSCLLCQEMYR